jgi:hypothetical protein
MALASHLGMMMARVLRSLLVMLVLQLLLMRIAGIGVSRLD